MRINAAPPHGWKKCTYSRKSNLQLFLVQMNMGGDFAQTMHRVDANRIDFVTEHVYQKLNRLQRRTMSTVVEPMLQERS